MALNKSKKDYRKFISRVIVMMASILRIIYLPFNRNFVHIRLKRFKQLLRIIIIYTLPFYPRVIGYDPRPSFEDNHA